MNDELKPNEWQQFAEDQKAKPAYPLRIRTMWAMHGKAEGKQCGGCEYFLRKRYAKVYRKCMKTRMTGGPATDWRANWPGCGLWVEAVKKGGGG